MQPIRQKLGSIRQLLISPDSQLNRIPFTALVDEQNHYLLETTAITDLTTGRNLLHQQNAIAQCQKNSKSFFSQSLHNWEKLTM